MILDTMKSLNNLTSQESYLLDYMLTNPKKVLGMNINELAHESLTSAATVFRLCKKAGINGYSEFKYIFASELHHIIELGGDLNIQTFGKEESLDDILSKVELIHKRSINYTKNILKMDTLLKVRSMLKETTRIEIYGEGMNYELAKLFCMNFEEAGVLANAYNSLNPMHTKYQQYRKEPVLAFILTHTGTNPHMCAIAKKLSKEKYYTISICDNLQREICKYCDESIVIMTTKNTLELSNLVYISSMHYLFDVFTSIKLIDNYDEIEEAAEIVDYEKKE
ncbi:MurR/RpiR family transcriptional regulator [Oceanobacillus sojae]|uniref:MurR/RpiR family transcriptional regulator n=1 Tax=Oceanobacillus sojae TaxID=582851 RepID=UPI0021A32B5A|nr:MurR/RpiR family transcriptional regulator [Oceanobacillus sojae]MCT1905229.1 MurR/RpiR family transcriptional regulator [Oceanobacillus sojae]